MPTAIILPSMAIIMETGLCGWMPNMLGALKGAERLAPRLLQLTDLWDDLARNHVLQATQRDFTHSERQAAN